MQDGSTVGPRDEEDERSSLWGMHGRRLCRTKGRAWADRVRQFVLRAYVAWRR